MKKSKKLGIWMDHSQAHLTEFKNDPVETRTVTSKFTQEVKEHSFEKGEFLMHNKEQHEQSDYYRELGKIIHNYDEVILFGPTEAKVELFNILQPDHHFAKVKIEIRHSDKMSENQQHAFVRDHFTRQL